MFAVCMYVFCADIIGTFDYDAYPYEMQLETLEFHTNMAFHNATYLKDAIEFYVKVEIEKAIHDVVTTKAHMTLDKLAAQASAEEQHGHDVKQCYEEQKSAAQSAVRDHMDEIEPCVVDIHEHYMELSEAVDDLIADAKSLVENIEAKVDECKGQPAAEIPGCLEYEIRQLQKRRQTLHYALGKLNEKYQETLGQVPKAIACIKSSEKSIMSRLYQVLVDIRVCHEELLDSQE